MSTTAPIQAPSHVPSELVVDIDIYNPGDTREDFHEVWAGISQKCGSIGESGAPLVFTAHNGGHWIAASGEALEELFVDDVNLSNQCITIPRRNDGIRFYPAEADGMEHTIPRKALTQVLTPQTVMALKAPIRSIVTDLLDEIQPKGRCDFMDDFAFKLPVKLFLSMLNLPLEDSHILLKCNHKMTRGASHAEKQAGLEGLFTYLRNIVDARYENPADDIISKLSLSEPGGERLSKEMVHAIGVNLLLGGLDTVGTMLGYIMRYLANNSEVREYLAEDTSRIERVREELIRRFPVAIVGRVVVQDFSYRGVELRTGDIVALPTQLHGMDKCVYSDPLSVVPNRRVPTNMSFGKGRHVCAGNVVARLEMTEALTLWLQRIPEFRVEKDADIRVQFGQVSALDRLPLSWNV